MRESVLTKAEEICAKISPSIAPEFFEGKREIEEFDDLLQRLRDNGELTKDEYQYAKKNTRHILLGLNLFYLVPELYDDRNTPTVFIQVSSLMALRLLREGKVKVLEEAVNILADQVRKTLGTPMTGYATADTLEDKLKNLKEEIKRLYSKGDVKAIQQEILRVKDDIIESVGTSPILHEMNSFTRTLTKSSLPDLYEINEKIDEWLERVK